MWAPGDGEEYLQRDDIILSRNWLNRVDISDFPNLHLIKKKNLSCHDSVSAGDRAGFFTKAQGF